MITFNDLLRTCPTIASLRTDAASIAEHEAHQWYPAWIAGSTIFAQAIG